MNLTLTPIHTSTRKSQRRRNKNIMHGNEDYAIPNPYRTSQSQKCLPSELGKQLSKMDFISLKSLQNIDYHLPISD